MATGFMLTHTLSRFFEGKNMRHDVSVYMRSICLDLIVPDNHVWEFMAAYGEEFKVPDSHSGVANRKPVEGYSDHPMGWHVQVRVSEEDEPRLYEFLRRFSQVRGLAFRDPEAQTPTA